MRTRMILNPGATNFPVLSAHQLTPAFLERETDADREDVTSVSAGRLFCRDSLLEIRL